MTDLFAEDEAFARLFNRCRPVLLGRCRALLRDEAAAEDIVQETFLRAVSHRSSFDPAKPLEPWLRAIALRLCIDYLRRQAIARRLEMETALVLDGRAANGDEPFEAARVHQAWARVREKAAELPSRQRWALTRHSIDGESYEKIATEAGTTVDTVKSLAARARRTLRKACEGLYPAVLVARLSSGRSRAKERLSRARLWVSHAIADPLTIVMGQPVTTVLLVATIAVAALAPALPEGSQLPGRAGSDSGSPKSPASGAVTHEADGGTRGHVLGGLMPLSAARPRGSVLGPPEEPTPEETRFTSIAASANYQDDHTLFAAGEVTNPFCSQVLCPVLFKSQDGGNKWKYIKTNGFRGGTLVLPPNYPETKRIFVMGQAGLQESTDAGATFRTLIPISGDVAISPAFGRGDDRVVIAAGLPVAYEARTSLVVPQGAPPPTTTANTVDFSPGNDSGRIIVFGNTTAVSQGELLRSSIDECSGSDCTHVVLPAGTGAPSVWFSPVYAKDRTTLALTHDALAISRDGHRSFQVVPLPQGVDEGLEAVLIRSSGDAFTTMLLAVSGGRGAGLYRSGNEGRLWERIMIPVPGFERGVRIIVATPDGRLLAGGADRSIACSDDGSSWSARCSPIRGFRGVANPAGICLPMCRKDEM